MLKGIAKIPELKGKVMTKRLYIVSKFGSNIQMIVIKVGSEQGETCKGIIMSSLCTYVWKGILKCI